MVSLRVELFKLSEKENSVTKVPYFSSRELACGRRRISVACLRGDKRQREIKREIRLRSQAKRELVRVFFIFEPRTFR